MAETGGEDCVQGNKGEIVMSIEGPAIGDVAFDLPHFEHGRRHFVKVRPADLGDEAGGHQLVDETAAVLESGICRQKLDVLMGRNAPNELANETAAVEFLGASQE